MNKIKKLEADLFEYWKKNLQIGNSVPPILSKVLAESILKYLK